MNAPLVSILHPDTLERLAGDGAFLRGQSYFREGRVLELARRDSAIQAKVRGAEEYAVRIWMHDEKIAFSCACPQGQERAFCKHAVAVVLALVAEVESEAPPGEASSRPPKSDPPTRAEPSPLPPRLALAKPVAPRTPPTSAPVAASEATSARSTEGTSSELPGRRRTDRSLADELRALSHEDLVVLVLESALDSDAFRSALVRKLRDKSERTR